MCFEGMLWSSGCKHKSSWQGFNTTLLHSTLVHPPVKGAHWTVFRKSEMFLHFRHPLTYKILLNHEVNHHGIGYVSERTFSEKIVDVCEMDISYSDPAGVGTWKKIDGLSPFCVEVDLGLERTWSTIEWWAQVEPKTGSDCLVVRLISETVKGQWWGMEPRNESWSLNAWIPEGPEFKKDWTRTGPNISTHV